MLILATRSCSLDAEANLLADIKKLTETNLVQYTVIGTRWRQNSCKIINPAGLLKVVSGRNTAL